MKIAVYTITKNEEQFMERWAKSCAEADYRLIVDTGSTDGTVQAAIDNSCIAERIAISPWRFDDARNAALALLPDDIDYCIALDADEVLTPGWRQHLESLDPSIVTRPRYKYVWSWNPDGTEGLVYSGDKIHARRGYRWKHPVHEVIVPVGKEVQQWVGLEIRHHPDSSKSRSQYLPLLELAVQEDPNDDRNQFYLGREYMFNDMKDLAEKHLLRHLELSTWRAERSTAMRYLSRVTNQREHWLLKACAESPDRREPWVESAQMYYEYKNWPMCFSSATKALSIKEKPMEYLCEAQSWGSTPHDLASISAWNMGMKEVSIKYSIDALRLEPSNPRLRSNCHVIHALTHSSKVDLIVPFKSNINGLESLLASTAGNSSVRSVTVIADGENARDMITAIKPPIALRVLTVQRGSGIHVMWNAGIKSSGRDAHLMFINDDVLLGDRAIDSLASTLDHDLTIGLICPNYDNRRIDGIVTPSTTTARGRYDGTGGIGGFAMMLRSSLAGEWLFDERMKWWYGDDDLVNWVNRTKGLQTCISGLGSCSENSSWTINNDPPDNFNNDVENDRQIFLMKWGG